MLTVRDLSVTYGDVKAVRGASCVVSRDEIVGIVGANGAGKSSLLHAITGVVPAASGEIVFDDRNIRGTRPEEISRRGAVLVPEGRQTFTRLTVEENLRVALAAVPRDKKTDGDLDACLGRFPVLRPLYQRPAGLLSGGEQQQLVIARALLMQPRLLMLDEPSLGLAPQIVAQVFELIREIHREGVPILLVEQNAAWTVQFADRVYVMTNGELAETDKSELSTPELLKAYLGRADESQRRMVRK